MVYVRTKKGRYGLTKEEFQRYMRTLWERAQTKKLVKEEMRQERENAKRE